jgi:thiamine biosynthesis lipoprotein
MKQVQIIMGTPVIVEIVDNEAKQELFDEVFAYFKYVDEKFSTYKDTSEITKINKNKIKKEEYSDDMKEIFALAEETKKLTHGYFDILTPSGTIDPSGLVKGWAIFNASKILKGHGIKNFYVEAGGDIQIYGKNKRSEPWCIGIQNPFKETREVIKKVYLTDRGIATSGTYVRGEHIYNPLNPIKNDHDIISLTVIGPDIYEADRYATAAFAMGNNGILFIEELEGFEGYVIDKSGIATMTTGFNKYTKI